jgi:hypothetical protein
VVRRIIPIPRRESNTRTLIVQTVAQCYTDWAITVLVHITWTSEIWGQKRRIKQILILLMFPVLYHIAQRKIICWEPKLGNRLNEDFQLKSCVPANIIRS